MSSLPPTPDAAPVAPRDGLAALVRFLVSVAIGVILLRQFGVEAYIVPSGSMAPTLLGQHRDVTCGTCGFRFFVGTEGDLGQQLVARETAECPNCGHAGNDVLALPDVSGDRLLVDRSVYRRRDPRRFEVAVFRAPHRASQTWIKRIVGLPGETIQLRGGDLYVNGDLLRKSLAEQRALAILVHDNRRQPPDAAHLPPRWRADDGGSRWQPQGAGFACPPSGEVDQVDWLRYRHWERQPHDRRLTQEAPLRDVTPYNQDGAAPHVIVDLLLRCRIRSAGSGTLRLEARDGTTRLEVSLDPQLGQARLDVAGQQRAEAAFAADLTRDTLLELSLFDRRCLLALDGEEVLSWDLPAPPQARPSASTPQPLAIGAAGLGVEVQDLALFRDLYHAPEPDGPGWEDRTWTLAENEYFVLGDNVSLSYDSRRWEAGPGVRAELMVGKAVVIHRPSRSGTLFGRPVQVPDWGRIGYIR